MEQTLNSAIRPAAPAASVRSRPRVVVIGSLTSSLVNFRYDLLRALSEKAEVLALAPEHDPATQAALEEIGVRFRRIPMARTGLNPVQDIVTLAAIWKELRRFRPDAVLPYTMKPIIYGCLAARLAGVKDRVALCTGLGYVFIDSDQGPRRRAIRAISAALYRVALKGAKEVVVYNDGDGREFRDHRLMDPETPLGMVPGSGINLDRFPVSDPPAGPPVFLMVARLMRDKGVRDYVEAARLLRRTHPDIRCQLLGPRDANPSSVSEEELAAWQEEGVIEYLGETQDVRPFLRAASVFVLPSYREGISRSVLEAMSTGRAIVTTDAPGCAEPVTEGVTGHVVPIRDPEALSRAMARFVETPSLVQSMGRASRREAEERFDVKVVNALLLSKLGLT